MLQLICLFLLSTLGFASVIEAPYLGVDYDQNPSSIEWRKIDSEHFEIIFPKEVEDEAQRATFLLEKAYPYVSRSMEVLPPKISLILQNQSTQSNGLVTLAPRRSEWYITPSFDPELSNTEWLKTLAVHEFRHVVQFQKTRRGFNRALEILLGQIGQALGIGLTLPPWYLEGDAVGMETALTSGGRGRLPVFERDLRALLLSGRKYTYDKTHLGSYRDYLPNHYVFGYFYTTYMRNMYGDLYLSELANASAANSYWPLNFYNSHDNLTNQSFEDFYDQVMGDLVKTWQAKLDQIKLTPYEVQNLSRKRAWTNYFYPQVTDDGKIFALKRGLSHINQFVLIDGKKEKTLLYPGYLMNEYPYKLRQGKVAFIEWELDPRWGYRDYSRLKVYDLKKDEIILDKRKTKWRLANLDHRGENIALVEWDLHQRQSIVVIDLKGKEVFRVPFPKEEVITSLDWVTNDDIVMVLKDRKNLKSLVQMNLTTENVTELLAKTSHNLGFVASHDGRVLLESPESGIDNIFLHEGKGLIQLTSSKFGAYAPVLHGNELLYNDYTADGMDVVKKKLPWKEEQKTSDSFFPFYEKFAQNEMKNAFEKELEKSEHYQVTPYSQVKNAINLHSWVILAPPLSSTITLAGISRDVLNKFTLVVGGSYNLNEQTTQGFVTSTWSHYWPVFDLRVGYGSRRQKIVRGASEKTHFWEEGTFEGGVQVPWKRITGRFTQTFSTRAFAKIIKVTNKISGDVTDVNNGALYSPGAEFDYSVLSRLAKRDVLPPWGATLAGHMEEGKDISGVKDRGSLQNLESRLYVPGFLRHHSFYQQLAYERQRDSRYQYASYIFYPRGTQNVFLQELTKYSANYTLPLLMPDWQISRYAYFKRIILNLFYDELNGRYRSLYYRAASTGWELSSETYFLRLPLPITLGVRGNYIISGQRGSNYEFFINTITGVY